MSWLYVLVYIVICFLVFLLTKFADGYRSRQSNKDKAVLLFMSFMPLVNLLILAFTTIDMISRLDNTYPEKERWYW